MFNKAFLVMAVFVVFVFGYLIGDRDTKEREAFGFTPGVGLYELRTSQSGNIAWILDTAEGHLWRAQVLNRDRLERNFVYVGQLKYVTNEKAYKTLMKLGTELQVVP